MVLRLRQTRYVAMDASASSTSTDSGDPRGRASPEPALSSIRIPRRGGIFRPVDEGSEPRVGPRRALSSGFP